MGIIYLVTVQLLISIGILELLSLNLGILVGIVYLIFIGVTLKEKSLLLYVIPILFFIRSYTEIEDHQVQLGDRITVISRIFQGRGEVLKREGKYPKNREYILVNNTKNGEYLIQGEVTKKTFDNYYILKDIESIENKPSLIEKTFEELIDNRIENMSYAEKNLYKAVVLGKKESIFSKTKKLFIETGLMHLLAISGLHLGIVVFILKFIGEKIPWNKRWKNIVILIALSLYCFSIRITPSVQRAYIMVFIYLLGNILYENASIKKSFCTAFILSLLINPIAYRSASFVMSYWAVLCIILFQPFIQKIHRYLKVKAELSSNKNQRILLRVKEKIVIYIVFAIYIQVMMTPISYIIFGKFSILAIISSIILTPIGSLYIFVAFIGIIIPISPIITIVYTILIKGMEFFS
ncbi:MAG: ComEC/Rec2 family competence protein [Fusobacteriaceae bacterium]